MIGKGSSMGCNNLVEQLDEVRSSPGNRAVLGEFGEAVAEVFLNEVLGHEVVFDAAARYGPQGIDLVAFDGERIVVVEVKATASGRSPGPRMSSTTTTRQMSD